MRSRLSLTVKSHTFSPHMKYQDFETHFLNSARILANIAESFREIEMIFMACDSPDPGYMEKLCHAIYNKSAIPIPKEIPKLVERIQYNFNVDESKENKKITLERMNKGEFEKRFALFQRRLKSINKNSSDLVDLYFKRQKAFYHSFLLDDSKCEETPSGVEFQSNYLLNQLLESELEKHSSFLCIDPKETARLISEKLHDTKKLTKKTCQELVLLTFVGRDISKNFELLPEAEKYIKSISVICFNLFNEIKKKRLNSTEKKSVEIKKNEMDNGELKSCSSKFFYHSGSGDQESMVLSDEEWNLILQRRQQQASAEKKI